MLQRRAVWCKSKASHWFWVLLLLAIDQAAGCPTLHHPSIHHHTIPYTHPLIRRDKQVLGRQGPRVHQDPRNSLPQPVPPSIHCPSNRSCKVRTRVGAPPLFNPVGRWVARFSKACPPPLPNFPCPPVSRGCLLRQGGASVCAWPSLGSSLQRCREQDAGEEPLHALKCIRHALRCRQSSSNVFMIAAETLCTLEYGLAPQAMEGACVSVSHQQGKQFSFSSRPFCHDGSQHSG